MASVATDTLDMHQAAAKAGRSYERFRKVWKDLVRDLGFPPPYQTRPYAWRSEPVELWRQRREAAIGRQVLGEPAAVANDHQPERRAPSTARINRQRSALRQKMSR